MRNRQILILIMLLCIVPLTSSFPNSFNLNVQTTNDSGDIITGSYIINFSIDSGTICNNSIYLKSQNITTDTRGIFSLVLDNVSIDFSSGNYRLCYFRDGILKSNTSLNSVPYSYYSLNTSTSGFIYNSNLNASNYNITASYFFGDGSLLNNISTFNSTYAIWSYNQSTATYNMYGIYFYNMTSNLSNYAKYQFTNNNFNGSGNFTTTNKISYNEADWAGGNVIYVPLSGNIQTYINNAQAGDTLILASGEYQITSTILVNKQINIRGQGSGGFYTTPIAPSHGTVISSSTAGIIAFNITSGNVRLSELSINLQGASSTGIRVDRNIVGIVFMNIDVIITSTGTNTGFYLFGSDVIMRDLTFYITSTNGASAGVYIYNDPTATFNSTVDCFSVTGTAVGASGIAYAFASFNYNTPYSITLNLANSVCEALSGTANDIAVISNSYITNNSIINSYESTFDGADYDAYVISPNQLNLGGSILVNAKTFGNVTYRATLASGQGIFSENVSASWFKGVFNWIISALTPSSTATFNGTTLWINTTYNYNMTSTNTGEYLPTTGGVMTGDLNLSTGAYIKSNASGSYFGYTRENKFVFVYRK